MDQKYLEKKFGKEIKGFLSSGADFEISERSDHKVCFLKYQPLQKPLVYILVDPFKSPTEKDLLKNRSVPLDDLSGLLAYKLLFDILIKAKSKIDFSKMYLILELIEMTGLDIMPFIVNKINFYGFYFSRDKYSFCLDCGRRLKKFSSMSFCTGKCKSEFCRQKDLKSKLRKIFFNNIGYLKEKNESMNRILEKTAPNISLIPIEKDYLVLERDKQLYEIYADLIERLTPLKKFILKRLNDSDSFALKSEYVGVRADYLFINEVSYGDGITAKNEELNIWDFYKNFFKSSILTHFKSELDPAHNHFQYDLFEFREVFEEGINDYLGNKKRQTKVNIINFMTMKKTIERNLLESFSEKKEFSNNRITRLTNKPLLRRL